MRFFALIALILGFGSAEAAEYRDAGACGRMVIQRVERILRKGTGEPVAVPLPTRCARLKVETPYFFEIWEDGSQTLFKGRQALVTFGFPADAHQAVIPIADGQRRLFLKDGRTETWERVGN
jgi:hypothetical protein